MIFKMEKSDINVFLIKKYEKIVEQFEKDNEPKEPMMVTGLANY